MFELHEPEKQQNKIKCSKNYSKKFIMTFRNDNCYKEKIKEQKRKTRIEAKNQLE